MWYWRWRWHWARLTVYTTCWIHTVKRVYHSIVGRSAVVAMIGVGVGVLWDIQLFTPQSRYGEYITLLRQYWLAVPRLLAAGVLVLLGVLVLWRRWSAKIHRFERLWWIGRSVLACAAVGMTLLDLGWYGLPLQPSADPSRVFRPTTDLVDAIGIATITNGQTADLLYPPTRFSTIISRDTEHYRVFSPDYPSAPPNTWSVYGFDDVRGYASLFSRRYLQFARTWENKSLDGVGWVQIYLTQANERRHLLDLMNVRYVLFTPKSALETQYTGLELVERNDEGALYRNPTALPRAFLVHQAEVVADDAQLLRRLAQATFPISTTVLLREAAPPLAPAQTGARERVTITRYMPSSITVAVEASAPAMLILSDSYYPGWWATVDGEPASVYAADWMLRGVAVPAGAHSVVFTYAPSSVRIGAILSVVGLIVVAGILLASRIKYMVVWTRNG